MTRKQGTKAPTRRARAGGYAGGGKAGGTHQKGPLSAAEVVAWFRESIKKRPVPSEEGVGLLVNDLRQIEVMKDRAGDTLLYPHTQKISEAHALIVGIVPELQKARVAIEEAIRILDSIGDADLSAHITVERAVAKAIRSYTERHPGREPGRGKRTWDWPFIYRWAEDVRTVLSNAGWEGTPSTINDIGVVPYVISKMIKWAFDEDVAPATVARHFRDFHKSERARSIANTAAQEARRKPQEETPK